MDAPDPPPAVPRGSAAREQVSRASLPPDSPPPDVAENVVAGRSALPAFLALEAWARTRTADADAAAETLLAEARVQAETVRREGEASLREALLAGEREALREVESRARDQISEARRAVEAWIGASEEAAQQALDEALALLCGGKEA